MRALRQIHLLLGCFFTPLLAFFLVSGWYQTANPDRRKSPQDAEAVFDRMRFVHAEAVLPSATATGYSSTAFRWLVYVMSAAMLVTAALGIILALRATKLRWAAGCALAGGALLPALLLWLGQKH